MIQNLSSVGQQFLANSRRCNNRWRLRRRRFLPGAGSASRRTIRRRWATCCNWSPTWARSTRYQQSEPGDGEVNTAESALETATQLLEQASRWARKARTAPLPRRRATALSQQVQAILSQLVSREPDDITTAVMSSAVTTTRSRPIKWI